MFKLNLKTYSDPHFYICIYSLLCKNTLNYRFYEPMGPSILCNEFWYCKRKKQAYQTYVLKFTSFE